MIEHVEMNVETVIALAAFLVAILWGIWKINGKQPKPEKKIDIAKLKFDHDKIGGTLEDRFFVECVLAEVDDFSKPENRKKAEEIAVNYRVDLKEGLETVFEKAKAEHFEMNRRRRESGNFPTGDDEIEEYDEED